MLYFTHQKKKKLSPLPKWMFFFATPREVTSIESTLFITFLTQSKKKPPLSISLLFIDTTKNSY